MLREERESMPTNTVEMAVKELVDWVLKNEPVV
jgi:hypothetical protein